MAGEQLRRGDRVVIRNYGRVIGIVERTWTDEETEKEFVALRTESRSERIFALENISVQEILSHNNEVPDKVGK